MDTNQTFHFQGKEIQIKIVDNEPWFLAADIAKALTVKDTSHMVTSAGVEDEDKCKIKNRTRGGYNRKMLFVSESGFYLILMMSRKPAADKFQSWLCEDVLPTIKRTGGYNLIQANTLPADYESKLLKAKAELARQNELMAQQQESLARQKKLFNERMRYYQAKYN